MINSNNFEYFLNAIHYSIYKEEVWSNNKISKIVNLLIALIFRIPFIRKYRKKYDVQKEKELNEFYYGNKFGLSIGVAHHWFGYFYSGYPALLSFILVGIADKKLGSLNAFTFLLLFAIPVGLCYVPAYKAVFTKDKYLEYFKIFEQEDKQWHKKWKWITISFCVGSVVVMLMGIVAMSIVGH